MEPPVSEPVAPKQKPAATAAPDPLLEPPLMCAVFQGFLTGPKIEASPVGP